MMYKIIGLNRRHIQQLAQIDNESKHQNTSGLFNKKQITKNIVKRFNEKHEIFFGYKTNNELVGYVSLKPFFPGYKHCEVYWLAVKNSYQGQGIGKTLMGFIEIYAKKKGFRKVYIYTGKNMQRTRKFYEKNGYKLKNEFPGFYGFPSGNTTAVLYEKKL